MSLGARIRDRRTHKGLSQQKLGEAIGAAQQTVQQWEKDKADPPRHQIIALSALFGVTPGWLEYGEFAEQTDPYFSGSPSTPHKKDKFPLSDQRPVYAALLQADGKLLLDTLAEIDRMSPPSNLLNVSEAFSFYMPDDSMSPRINAGELVWVNPNRRAAVGQTCVAVETTAPGESAFAGGILKKINNGVMQIEDYKGKTHNLPGEWTPLLVMIVEFAR